MVASGVAAAAAEGAEQLHSCSQKLEGAATACSLPAERWKICPLTALSISPNFWPITSSSSERIWCWRQWSACSSFWLAAAAVLGKRALRALLQICSAAHWAAPQLSSKRQRQIIFASRTSSIFRSGDASKTKVRHRKGRRYGRFFLVGVLRILFGRRRVSRTEGMCSCVVSWWVSRPRKQKRRFWHFSTGLHA